MKQKIIILSVLLLIGVSSLVLAEITKVDNTYYVEQKLEKGWNLVAGFSPSEPLGSSRIQLNDISAIWYYDSQLKKYFEIYPEFDEELKEIRDASYVYSHAFWVYSEKSDIFDYKGYKSLVEKDLLGGYQQFYSGWNFLALNDFIVDGNLNDLRGDCDIQKAFIWNSQSQGWDSVNLQEPIQGSKDYLTGKGMVVKVTQDCKFLMNAGSDGTTLPQLPE